ncbi:unnamed protein product [Thelazia callipaeda]|uniref:Ovule protein n=1 Tax=Thelazia callipaeda TaxID=103827 RepID=A0A0N5CPV6_THECL|nr:unnamed protein product [Thelazia callipaeda]
MDEVIEEQPNRHNVENEEIKKFRDMVWNSGMEKDNHIRHNEYLGEFISDHEAHDTFPSEDEFGKTSPYLPIWKAPVSSVVYNFFI